jgi:hypothetical protein
MSLKEGRNEGRRSWSWRVLCEKVPPARARGRNAPIFSLHETGQQKLTIIRHCGTGLVEEEGGLFLDSQPIVGPNPRWAFLGRHCGSRPNGGSAFLGHSWWDQTKVGFSWTALWNRTKPNAEEAGLFLDALVEPDHNRPEKTRRDKTKADEEKVGFA